MNEETGDRKDEEGMKMKVCLVSVSLCFGCVYLCVGVGTIHS